MSMGLDAAELIKSGIRADVVQHCCRELGVPLAGTIPLATPSTSAVDAMRQAAMASRKRKMAPTAIGAPSLDRSLPDAGKRHEHSGTRPRVPHNDVQHSATTGASPGDGSPPEPPLSAPKGPKTMQQQQQKRYRDVDAPSQSAQQLEDEVAQAFLESSEASMTSSLDPRQSRHAGLYYGDDFARGVEAPSGYVDYSAPLPRLEFPPLHRSGTESPGPASRPIATPSNGHVVHANRKGRRRPGTEEVQARVSRASRRRKQPFLPHLNQSIVLDFSDDSSEEEGGGSEETSLKPSSSGLGDDSNKRRKEIRNASTSFIHAAWRKKIELEAEEQQQRRQQLSPAPPSTPTSAAAAAATPRLSSGALALLREKEKEIEALKERMRELERRRVHAESLDLSKTRAAVERDEEADPTHSAVTDAADRGATQEDSQKDAPQEDEVCRHVRSGTVSSSILTILTPFSSTPLPPLDPSDRATRRLMQTSLLTYRPLPATPVCGRFYRSAKVLNMAQWE